MAGSPGASDGVGYGDAVILKDASGEYLIKRIAGLPGDVMEALSVA